MIIFFARRVVLPPSKRATSTSLVLFSLPHPFTYSTCVELRALLLCSPQKDS